MKKFLFLTVLFSTLLLTSCNNKTAKTFSNPIPVKFGDPFILYASDGKFYMYGTDESGLAGFKCHSSTDLTHWTDEGVAYKADTSSWGTDMFWAPEVYEKNGKYYMFYSSNWKENPNNEEEIFRIGVAVSDKPTGPFTEMYDQPIFDPGYPIIDANLLFDKNGKTYLYYSRCCYKHPVESEISKKMKEEGKFQEIEESWVYGVEIKPDFSGIIGKPVCLLQPPYKIDDPQAEWESRSVLSGEINRRWTEGSFIFEHNGTYYMMYSGNYYKGEHYAVGYATSKNPLGPFVKADNNPVLEKNTPKGGIVTGTGHNMVLSLPNGQMYCVYHGRTKDSGDARVVFIDPMEITSDGKLIVHGPTTTPQPVPQLK